LGVFGGDRRWGRGREHQRGKLLGIWALGGGFGVGVKTGGLGRVRRGNREGAG